MPIISHSAIEMFQGCNRRWWLTKVAKVPQAPAEALIFGTAIHAALEADGRRKVDGGAGLGLPQLVTSFGDALAVELADRDPHGLLGQATRDEMGIKGLAVLRAYVERVQPHYHPAVVECDLTAPLPGMSDDWQFTGRIDALTQRVAGPDATLVDWKTASKPWGIGIEHQKPQAAAYLWLAEASGAFYAVPNRVTFIVFVAMRRPNGEGYDVDVQFRPTRRMVSQRTAWLNDVSVVAVEMAAMRTRQRAEDVPANTGPLCGWCSCLAHCEAGRKWLASRGRKPAVPVLPVAAEVAAAAEEVKVKAR